MQLANTVISTTELSSYVNEVVQDITYKKWGYEQVPQVNLHGREFPIGMVGDSGRSLIN